MMKKSIVSRTLLGLSLVGMTLSTTGLQASAAARTAAGQTIRIAADTTFPPFESEVNGQVTGFDIDMIKAIAKKEHLKVSAISPMPFTGLIPALNAGQVDVAVAGITIKKSRMVSVNFSNAYYKSGLSILVKSNSKIKSLADLKGKLVATKKGTSSVDLLTKSGVTGSNIKQFDNIDDAYNALMTGGADAVVFDNPVNVNFKAKHKTAVKTVGGLLTGEYYGIAISKKDAGLVSKINDGLKKIQADGEYAALFTKYFGGDKSGLVVGTKTAASVALNQ